jgi:hypothetical protein
LASIYWAIWKLGNRSCFEHKLIKKPVELISYSIVFMKHWAGLHSEKDADDLRAGADALLRLASTSNIGGATQDGSRQQQRPLQIRDARDSAADGDDMEVEDQEDANA